MFSELHVPHPSTGELQRLKTSTNALNAKLSETQLNDVLHVSVFA
jgi:hypothetical protein